MSGDVEKIVEAIDAEYDMDTGFLGRLRYRHFDPEGLERFLDLLRSIDLGDAPTVDRRLVSLLWFVPLFMQRQDRSYEGDVLEASQRGQDRVLNEIQRILGLP